MLADSNNDIIVMIRMSVKTNEERLPAQHEKWLQSAGVKMKYLPKNVDEKSDTFFTAILDKFTVLDMVEYNSVLFLDTDVLPLCNLDYVFDLVPRGTVLCGIMAIVQEKTSYWLGRQSPAMPASSYYDLAKESWTN